MGSCELALLDPPALDPSVGMNISAGDENASNDGAPESTNEEALIALALATTIWPWLEAAPSSFIGSQGLAPERSSVLDDEDVAESAGPRLGDLGNACGSMLSLGDCHALRSSTCTMPITSQPSPSSAPDVIGARAASGKGTAARAAARAAAAARNTKKHCQRGNGRHIRSGMRL